MRFSYAALFLLLITALLAFSLVFASNAKNSFYEKLQENCESIISKVKENDPVEIDANEVLPTEKLLKDGWIKIHFKSGYYKEFRYYHEKRVIAIDNLDERGRLVRRDIFHKDKIRIELFYNTKGDLIKRNWINQDDKIIDTKTIFIPLTNTRSGY